MSFPGRSAIASNNWFRNVRCLLSGPHPHLRWTSSPRQWMCIKRKTRSLFFCCDSRNLFDRIPITSSQEIWEILVISVYFLLNGDFMWSKLWKIDTIVESWNSEGLYNTSPFIIGIISCMPTGIFFFSKIVHIITVQLQTIQMNQVRCSIGVWSIIVGRTV
jgi:hypothetical protein